MTNASKQQVYTLVVEVGRKPGDGLPDKATGAALMCYASGVDEAEAVRETVAILKQADMAESREHAGNGEDCRLCQRRGLRL